MTPVEARWTSVVRPAEGPPDRRVVVFPHAGSGPNALLPLLGCLPLLAKLWSLDPALRLPMADEIDIRTPVPPWPSPPVVLPKPRLRPPPPSRPSSPSPGLPGLIAAILAALVGGVVAFRDALIPFLQHLFGG